MWLSRRSLVISLLFQCSPATVFGFVVAVVVDTIESETGRSFAHVGKEILKRKPAFTDSDSAAAVVGITALLAIAASG